MEKDINTKYTIMYAYTERGKRDKPQTEFGTIDEVIRNFGTGYNRRICYLIGAKSEKMDTWPQALESEDRKPYITCFEWDNKIRKEYGQEPRKEVMNVFYKDNRTLLRRIEEFYKISIHDEYLMSE